MLNGSSPLERLWVRLIDSNLFRRHIKYGVGSHLLHAPVYRNANRLRLYWVSKLGASLQPERFSDVRTYCTFIGHNKSGTTLLGSLIDAHPNAILADEADALQYIAAGFQRDQLYHLLNRSSRRELLKGRVTARRLGGYSLLVPGQWQGRFSRLHVIGDSTSGTSTRRLAESPDLIRRMKETMPGVQTRFIQVVRNPFDPIAAMMVRGKRSFKNASGHYFAGCDALLKIRAALADSELMVVRYEDFIQNPEAQLEELCNFLGLESRSDYLQAARSILYPNPDRLRGLITWQPEWIREVEQSLAAYDFLEGYGFTA